MSITILILPIFTFLGCSERVRYIKKECPKLVTFARDKNETLYSKKMKLSLQRYDKQFFLIEEEDLKMLSKWVQHLKIYAKDNDEVIDLYEKEIAEANSL